MKSLRAVPNAPGEPVSPPAGTLGRTMATKRELAVVHRRLVSAVTLTAKCRSHYVDNCAIRDTTEEPKVCPKCKSPHRNTPQLPMSEKKCQGIELVPPFPQKYLTQPVAH